MPRKLIGIPSEYLTAFGNFVVVWSRFEHVMASQFSKASDIPLQKATMLFFSISGFAGHRDLLKAAIADTAFKQPPQEILDILSAAEPLNGMRNELVHGDWMGVRDGQMCVTVAKPKSAMRLYTVGISLETILAAIDDVEALTDRLAAASVIHFPRVQQHGKKDASD